MLAYTLMAAYGEFERGMISKRTKEGLAAARKRGARLGRPPRLSEKQLRRARRRIERERIPVKKLLAEQMLHNAVLKDLLGKN
jgi:DNA invertase Pin-like site-specific DNA recombinase